VTVDEGSVQLAHEALIREWPRLRRWLDEDRAALRLHRHLTAAADAWVAADRDASELYRGQRLAAATEWRASGAALSTTEAAFVDASVAAQELEQRTQARTNRRLRVLLSAVALVLVVALVAGGVAFVQRRNAAHARDRADVSRVAAVSRSVIDRQADLGLLLAVAAYRLDQTSETRSTLLSALTAHPLLLGLLHGEASGLEAAVFSPDGRTLATPTSDGTGTILWDTRTRREVATLKRSRVNLGAAFSPDGRRLAVPVASNGPDEPGGMEIWDVGARRLERFLPSPSGSLTTATWSRDGRLLIAQGGVRFPVTTPPPTSAAVWDARTWRPQPAWRLNPTYVGDRLLAASADGRRIALPAPDGSVRVWDVATRAPVGEPLQPNELLGRDAGGVTTMAFSRDGSLLAIGLLAGAVVVVDVDRGRRASPTLALSDDLPSSIEFSPDDAVIAVGRVDGHTQLFDRESATALGTPLAANAAGINDVSFSRDGSMLATGGLDRTGALWSLDGHRAIGVPLTGQSGYVTQATYTRDGRLLTAATDGTVAVRDGATGRIARRLRLGTAALTVAIDDARGLVAAGGRGPSVRVWRLDTGEPGASVDVGDAWVHHIAFRPDGRVLAVTVDHAKGDLEQATGREVGLRFVDATTGRDVGKPIVFDNGDPIAVAWSPDGARIAVVTPDNFMRIYDVATRRQLLRIENVDAPMLDAAFSQDGTRVVTGTNSCATRQWDATTGKEIPPALVGQVGPIGGVAFGAGDTLLATTAVGLSTTRLWEMPDGRPFGADLVGGRVPYTTRTGFSDGDVVQSRSAFSPVGAHLATAGGPGAAELWDLTPEHWVRAACAVAGRELSAAEWREELPARHPFALCS